VKFHYYQKLRLQGMYPSDRAFQIVIRTALQGIFKGNGISFGICKRALQ